MIATYLYRNPRLLVLAITIIVAAGLSAYHVLPRLEDPVLSRRVALVTTIFPGADTGRVEALVTEKLEETLQELGDIKEIQSASSSSNSIIVIELRDEVVEVDEVWSRVRDKLVDAAANLPDAASRPRLRILPLKAYAAIVAIRWDRKEKTNYAILRRLAKDLKQDLRQITGTEDVDLFGDPGEEVVVEVEPATLASLDLTIDDISRQIRSTDIKQSAGTLRGSTSELLMEINEQASGSASAGLDSLERLRQTPVQYGIKGRFVALSEITSISKQIVDPATSLSFVDSAPAVVLGAFVRDDYRIDHWTQQLETTLATYSPKLPAGIDVDVIFLQNDYVVGRLQHLQWNLLLGAAAVAVVVFCSMGWRSTIVVASALPLSTLMVLAGMRALDVPLDQMSITGLIIALGLLIDNAIVIVDEVRTRLWSGLPPAKAMRDGIRHLAVPLFGSTLTTTLALAPIALLPGAPGEFVRSIGITVILAISSSFLLAMTVVPPLTAFLEPASSDRHTFWRYGFTSRHLVFVYRRSLELIFRFPWIAVALGITLPVLGFLHAPTLPEQFFPAVDRDQIQIEIELASTTTLAETQQVALAVDDVVTAHEQVARSHWFVGQSAPTFFYNLMPRRFDSAFYAQGMIELESNVDAREVIQQLQTELDAQFAQCRILVRQLEQGPPFDAPIEVRLFGPDLAQLQSLGAEVRLLLTQTSEVLHTRSDLEETQPKLTMRIDAAETRLAGLNQGEITRQLYAAVEGSSGGSLLEETEELPIRVRFSRAARASLDEIALLQLQSPIRQGSPTRNGPSLAAFTRLNLTSDVATIPRLDGHRVNEVKAYITAGTLPAQVVTEFERRMAASDFRLPDGYSMEYGGEAAKRDEAVQNLLADVAVLVVLMLATLVISFRSFRISMIIAAVGGLSIGLGLFALWTFGYPFGFMAILGTLGLVGIAINDAIVVMAGIRDDPRARRGDVQALSDVVTARTRHVVATSLTTMAAFTPLVLAGGGFWPPLAVAIGGGVAGATILALYFVPAVYLLLMCNSTENRVLRSEY